MTDLRVSNGRVAMSTPSINILPSNLCNRRIVEIIDDFPAAVFPTMAIFS
jgi:hypothetical protein